METLILNTEDFEATNTKMVMATDWTDHKGQSPFYSACMSSSYEFIEGDASPKYFVPSLAE